MWIRRLGSMALVATLMLASLAGLVDHDHGAGAELDGYDCVVEHQDHLGSGEVFGAAQRGPTGSVPELQGAAQPHRHRCIGCHQNGQRLFLTSFQSITAPSLDADRSPETLALLWAARAWTSRSLRGPPSA